MEQLKKKQTQFYQQVIVPIEKGKVNHAYLIEVNNNQEEVVKNYIKTMCKKILISNRNCNFDDDKISNLVDKNNYPDIIEIRPINNTIKKEQLLKVKEQFSEKSLYSNYQIYIIYNADKLNSSSGNTILKFLEEPEDGIIGIFVTNNRYNVLNTIQSRCTTAVLKQEPIEVSSLDVPLEIYDFIDNIKNRTVDNILVNYKLYQEKLFTNKEVTLTNINIIILLMKNDFYKETLENANYSNKTMELLNILEILEKYKEKVKYNVNIKLWLDALLVEIMEVENASYNS